MSQSYLDLVETNFPQAVDTFDRATDVTLDLLPLVQEYQTLYQSGKLNDAANLLNNHPELQNCMINAKTINRCYDGIKALQRYYFSDIQKYIEELITYRGDYSSKSSYEKYDVVIYNSSAYLCISDSGVGVLPTSNKWVQITLKGDQGEPGLGLNFMGSWVSTITYQKDSCVTYNNILYASNIDNNIAKTPAVNSAYWSLVFDISQFKTYDNSSSGLNSVNLEQAIDEVNLKVNVNTNEINANRNNISINSSNIANINSRISNVNNTADSNKSVKYAASAGVSDSCTGNSDSVDGFHFKVSSTNIEEGSILQTNMFYFVYE